MKVAILGTGLIGGSIGLALKKSGQADSVVAYDASPAVAARAVERGVADAVAGSPAEAASGADIVFLAAPVGALVPLAEAAIPAMAPSAILTDVGSTKYKVVHDIEKLLGSTSPSYIGGHPMAGTEEEGVEAAKAGLFEGAWWILTPTPGADPDAFARLHAILTRIGAQVMAMDPDQHDDLLAVISHLPHLTAATLMGLASERGRGHAGLLALAAGGFRDLTRVAASNPQIWLDICRENHAAIEAVLAEFSQRLLELRDLIARGDGTGLRERFIRARQARRELGRKPTDGTLHQLWIPVPDRPGVLAQVTTLVGNLGVNIEDLEIAHAEEGGRGAIRLTIAGAEPLRKVAEALEAQGYETRSTSL